MSTQAQASNTDLSADEAIVARANELARQIYKALGYEVREGYEFQNATHPQEALCWRLAEIAFENLLGTELDQALSNIEDDNDD